MVCTGAKSEEDSRLAARKYARIIQKLGFEVSIILYFQFILFNIINGYLCPLIITQENKQKKYNFKNMSKTIV